MKAGESAKILVVDDDKPIREYLRYLLEDNGYEVVDAANGNEGVQAFRTQEFDCVITDISMPEKDGIDAIIEMRELKPRARIIAISGVAKSEKLLEIAKMYNADKVIKKPFDGDMILSALDQVLGASS